MSEQPESFIDYWDAVDAALLRFFGIDTWDTNMDADQIAEAQEEGWMPEELARWYGNKHDLDYLDDSVIVSYDTISLANRGTP